LYRPAVLSTVSPGLMETVWDFFIYNNKVLPDHVTSQWSRDRHLACTAVSSSWQHSFPSTLRLQILTAGRPDATVRGPNLRGTISEFHGCEVFPRVTFQVGQVNCCWLHEPYNLRLRAEWWNEPWC
jgi:hypothetical protein